VNRGPPGDWELSVTAALRGHTAAESQLVGDTLGGGLAGAAGPLSGVAAPGRRGPCTLFIHVIVAILKLRVFPFDVVLDQVSPGTSDPISFVAGRSAKTDFAQVVKRLFVRP